MYANFNLIVTAEGVLGKTYRIDKKHSWRRDSNYTSFCAWCSGILSETMSLLSGRETKGNEQKIITSTIGTTL
jgi:hypothetical protein